MEQPRTTDSIITTIRAMIKNRESIAPDYWAQAAEFLNVLLGEETDKLADLQQRVAELKVELLNAGKSVAESKTRVEATNTYKEMNKQNSKIKQIEEFIRINKLRSRLKMDEYKL